MKVAAICMAFAMGPTCADALAQGATNVMEKIRACSLLAPAEELECLEKLSREMPLPKGATSEAARADALARDLDTAQRKIEALTAAAKAAASEAAQAKQAAERAATAEKTLAEERARVNALASDLDAAQRKIEALTAAAKTANDETARVREEATRGAEELQRSRQQERARADALERDLAAVRREFEAKVNASGKSAEEATRLQQMAERSAAELRQELQEERYRSEKLAGELAAAGRVLKMQATSVAKPGDSTAQKQTLSELGPALQQAERAALAYEELWGKGKLPQSLARELAARPDTTAGAARTTTARPSNMPGPAPGSEATTASLAKAEKTPMPAGRQPGGDGAAAPGTGGVRQS